MDIHDDMFWRFLKDQQISVEKIMTAFPMGRLARPAELVAAVRYLLSDDARFVTGTSLVLDGGYTASSSVQGAGNQLLEQCLENVCSTSAPPASRRPSRPFGRSSTSQAVARTRGTVRGTKPSQEVLPGMPTVSGL